MRWLRSGAPTLSDSRLNTTETTPPSIPYNPATAPLRGRQSGVDLKPPQAAVVKSHGGERCGKVGPRFRQVRLGEASVSEPLRKCRNRISCHGRVAHPER